MHERAMRTESVGVYDGRVGRFRLVYVRLWLASRAVPRRARERVHERDVRE